MLAALQYFHQETEKKRQRQRLYEAVGALLFVGAFLYRHVVAAYLRFESI